MWLCRLQSNHAEDTANQSRRGGWEGYWLAVFLWLQSLICKMGANGKEKPAKVILRKMNQGCFVEDQVLADGARGPGGTFSPQAWLAHGV